MNPTKKQENHAFILAVREAVEHAWRQNRESDAENCDIRLQLYPDGFHWALRVGSSDYDQDHRGFWGSSSVPPFSTEEEPDLDSIAEDLVDQVLDDKACSEACQ